MKVVQVIYGYMLLMSVVYLVTKCLSLIVPIEFVHFFVIILVLTLMIFKVNPHPKYHHYPFAFQLKKAFFLHRN